MHGNVEKSCDMSLERLGVQYIDLLLIHCIISGNAIDVGPIAFKAEADGVTGATGPDGKPVIDHERSNDHSDAWKQMESLVQKGKVRSIGIPILVH